MESTNQLSVCIAFIKCACAGVGVVGNRATCKRTCTLSLRISKRRTVGVLDVAITAAEAQRCTARRPDELCPCEAGEGNGVGERHAEHVHQGPHRRLDVWSKAEREAGEEEEDGVCYGALNSTIAPWRRGGSCVLWALEQDNSTLERRRRVVIMGLE